MAGKAATKAVKASLLESEVRRLPLRRQHPRLLHMHVPLPCMRGLTWM